MEIICGLDVHRKQITFDYLEIHTGEVRRGQIRPATREHLRGWLSRFEGKQAAFALEATTGWKFVVEELQRADVEPHLAEPADTKALRGPKKRANATCERLSMAYAFESLKLREGGGSATEQVKGQATCSVGSATDTPCRRKAIVQVNSEGYPRHVLSARVRGPAPGCPGRDHGQYGSCRAAGPLSTQTSGVRRAGVLEGAPVLFLGI